MRDIKREKERLKMQQVLNTHFETTGSTAFKSIYETAPAKESAFGNYVSTTNQTTITNKEQNSAFRSYAMAGFVLNNSASLNNYNLAMKQAKLSAVTAA